MNLYILVQNALITLITNYVAGTGFLEITYAPDGKASLSAKVTPSNVRANEVAGTFEEDTDYMRGYRVKRDDWNWVLLLSFPRKVEFENFKNEVITNGIKVNRTSTTPPVFLNFQSFTVEHGVEEQGSANGTEVTFTFNASVEKFR